jgi:chitin synthase
MNASLLFLIIGTGWLICPASPQLSPGQISSYNSYDDSALVYMYGSYYSAFTIISDKTHQDQNNNPIFWQEEILGRDVSEMFPKKATVFW